MPSENAEKRPGRLTDHLGITPPVTENVQCPRCESTNTKFCYYNNYNMSQPRYFCKGCRRYWTQGGALRNIPVGGNTRKATKRFRGSSNSDSPCSSVTHDPAPINTPISFMKPEISTVFKNGLNQNDNVVANFSNGPGFLSLGGYGVGIGIDELGLWSFPEICGGYGFVGGGDSSAASSVRNAFPMSIDGGWPDVDCYGWPDLAISMSGNSLK